MHHTSHKVEFATRVVRAVTVLTALMLAIAISVFAGTSPQSQSKPQHTASNAGDWFVLGDLQIEGEVPDRDALRDAILKQWQDTPYGNEQGLAQMITMSIAGEVEDRGYLRARAELQDTRRLGAIARRERILVIASVEEGSLYYIGGVTVRTSDRALPVPPPEVVQEQFPLKRGQLFNTAELGRGLRQLNQGIEPMAILMSGWPECSR